MPQNDGNLVKRTSQYIDNLSFDEGTGLQMVELAGTDGTNIYRVTVNPDGSLVVGSSPTYITQIYTDATYTYVCDAVPATALATAAWRVSRIDSAGDVRFAGSAATFVNTATDLTTVQGFTYG